jgi:hypothetical protein
MQSLIHRHLIESHVINNYSLIVIRYHIFGPLTIYTPANQSSVNVSIFMLAQFDQLSVGQYLLHSKGLIVLLKQKLCGIFKIKFFFEFMVLKALHCLEKKQTLIVG